MSDTLTDRLFDLLATRPDLLKKYEELSSLINENLMPGETAEEFIEKAIKNEVEYREEDKIYTDVKLG